MCESRVVIERNGTKQEVMAEASKISVNGKEVIVTDILGKSKTLENSTIIEINLLEHVVTVVENED